MWKWLTDGDSSWLFGMLMQMSVAALLLYAMRSGCSWFIFSIPCASLLIGGAAVNFGGLGRARSRYAPVGRRPWRGRQER